MRKLGVLDSAFLQVEKREYPMHVAGLQIFKLPFGYKKSFFKDLMKDLCDTTKITSPFNLKLQMPSFKKTNLPAWVEDKNFDMEYHVRHSALPWPGSMDDLLTLVAHLHRTLLDRNRPLWEFHLIEGLEQDRFAVYFKIHHACMDGVTAMKLMQDAYSESPDENKVLAPWHRDTEKLKDKFEYSLQEKFGKLYSKLVKQGKSVPEFAKTFLSLGLHAISKDKADAPFPFMAPATRLNVPITGHRRIAVNSFKMDRIKKLAKATDATLNDIVLTICSGALRRYVKDLQELPDKPLIACVPVAIRITEGQHTGNQVSAILCNLGTQVADPFERFNIIKNSANKGKEFLNNLSRESIQNLTVISSFPIAIFQALNLSKFAPPPFNLFISNVPGPSSYIYLKGARMEELYPVSAIIDGFALNITIASYVDLINFGLIACRTALPDVNNLSVYISESFDELEEIIEKKQ